MAYAGKFKGTYYDPSKRRLVLQLKAENKSYGVDLIHEAAAQGNFDGIMKAWVLVYYLGLSVYSLVYLHSLWYLSI